jgi:acyl carrier protein
MEHQDRLQRVFRDVFDMPELQIRSEMTADDIEYWDSLAHVSLIASIEAEFNIRFSLTEIQDLRNVGDLTSTIQRKLSA